MRKKIALIGGGQIGQILAMLAAQKELGDIVILDIPELENPAKGKALDLMEMAPHGNYDAAITGTSDYKDIAGADVVIITAGRPRQAGMTREDLLAVNLDIITKVAAGVKEHAPKALCIIVTNPLDAMVYAFYKLTGKKPKLLKEEQLRLLGLYASNNGLKRWLAHWESFLDGVASDLGNVRLLFVSPEGLRADHPRFRLLRRCTI